MALTKLAFQKTVRPIIRQVSNQKRPHPALGYLMPIESVLGVMKKRSAQSL